MKKTQFKDALRNIKRRWVSWLSIATIMMIGTTGFLGLQSVSYAIRSHGLRYFERYNLSDFTVASTVGISEEDLDVIRSLDSVNDAEGIISIETLADNGDDAEQMTVFAMNDRISIPLISDGKMPKEPYECAICLDLMEKLELSLGDRIHILKAPSAPSYVIREGDYIVCGVVDSPEHFTRSLDYYAVFPDNAINVPGLGNDYTKAYVDVAEPSEVDPFSPDYYQKMEPFSDEIEDLFGTLTELENKRIEELKQQAADDGMELPEIPEVKWNIAGRTLNPSFINLTSSYMVLSSISAYFAPLFVLIAFMVCFSTITIIVEEQKTQIGTQKALGMSNRQVRSKYMLFGLSGTVFGVATGVLGAMGVEKIMNHTLSGMYLFDEIPVMINDKAAKIIIISFLVFAAVVIFVSCNNMVRWSAVGLMNGSEPIQRFRTKTKSRSRKGHGIYLSLVFSNIISDLPRVIVSLIIVLESVMMIGMGFSLDFGLWDAVYNQMTDIWKYTQQIDTDGDPEHMADIASALDEIGYPYVVIHTEMCEADNEGTEAPVIAYLYAMDTADGKVYDYFRFADRHQAPVLIPKEGVLVTAGMDEKDGMIRNTELEIINAQLDKGSGMISDVFVNYMGKYVIFSKSGYEKAFGKEPEGNTFLVDSKDDEEIDVVRKLSNVRGITSITSTSSRVAQYSSLIDLFDLMVLIIIAMVIMLAFMIQLNLCNIQVNRRMKELLIMRVNGFTMTQVIGYLAREAIIITGLGIAFGIVCGIPFSSFMIRQVELGEFMFVRGPFPIAWIISGVLCGLFSFFINVAAYARIRLVPVTDILKY